MEIATSAKSMGFKYFGKVFPQKSKFYVWCKKFFLDELVLMLFGAAADSLQKIRIYCLVWQFSAENYKTTMVWSFLNYFLFTHLFTLLCIKPWIIRNLGQNKWACGTMKVCELTLVLLSNHMELSELGFHPKVFKFLFGIYRRDLIQKRDWYDLQQH